MNHAAHLASLAYVRSVPVPQNMRELLCALHDAYGRTDAQTVRGGTMVSLSQTRYKAVSKLLAAFTPWIDEYAGYRYPWRYQGAWTVCLWKGGHHIEHNHPKGWVSGVYYVQTGAGGALKVGADTIQPEAGMLALFPSHIGHATTPHEGAEPRLTVAFDVVRA